MTIMMPYCVGNILKKIVVSNALTSVPRRYRYKKKWMVNLKEVPNCQHALNNFDAFYKPYYGDQWPSLRVCLTSLPKYCAVVNTYANTKRIISKLEDLDTSNFVKYAKKIQSKEEVEKLSVLKKNDEMISESLYVNSSPEEKVSEVLGELNHTTDDTPEPFLHVNASNIIDPTDKNAYADNLNVFVPTEQVYSENEMLLREELNLNAFQPRNSGIKILPAEFVNISENVDAFVFAAGDVSLFPQPKAQDRILGYYLMDAGSVMPVIALDVHPTDQVLDLCAAPGGKTYVILQSLNLFEGGTLSCCDSSNSRLLRLRNILASHFPADVAKQVTVTKMDGTEVLPAKYNKVLVDVPCNSDRHVATVDDNNLFKMSRARERLGMMETQKELLICSIKACVPGGTIVYSTCTLSPVQNDGVIQAVLEELMETSAIEVVVVDLSPLADLFSHVFKFCKRSRYGQQILPTLLNNFGPTYFAKLKRIK